MCQVLGVSRSGYYKWRNRREQSANCYTDLDDQIMKSYRSSRGNYGSPRIAEDLEKKGLSVSASTVARRMQAMAIQARRQRKFRPCTTDSAHELTVAPNRLARDFTAEKIGEKWVSDLTYLKVGRSWHYLTVVIDLADRMVVGWALSENMTAEHTTIKAFEKAISNRTIGKGLLFHSDRGVQYAAHSFTQRLDQHQCIQSMSRKGNCWDNAVAEAFFKTIKVECINHHSFLNSKQAYTVIFDYIDGWYNTKRIHSALKGKTPREAALLLQKNKAAA